MALLPSAVNLNDPVNAPRTDVLNVCMRSAVLQNAPQGVTQGSLLYAIISYFTPSPRRCLVAVVPILCLFLGKKNVHVNSLHIGQCHLCTAFVCSFVCFGGAYVVPAHVARAIHYYGPLTNEIKCALVSLHCCCRSRIDIIHDVSVRYPFFVGCVVRPWPIMFLDTLLRQRYAGFWGTPPCPPSSSVFMTMTPHQ